MEIWGCEEWTSEGLIPLIILMCVLHAVHVSILQTCVDILSGVNKVSVVVRANVMRTCSPHCTVSAPSPAVDSSLYLYLPPGSSAAADSQLSHNNITPALPHTSPDTSPA